MLNKISKLVLITVFTIVVAGCSNSKFSHEYFMRGQVISTENDVVICVGTADGAKVGQTLTAYRFMLNDDNDDDQGADFFKKIEIGQVKIDQIVNEHFAKVTILSGDVRTNDMVQLNR